jgi:hypothetical protein
LKASPLCLLEVCVTDQSTIAIMTRFALALAVLAILCKHEMIEVDCVEAANDRAAFLTIT